MNTEHVNVEEWSSVYDCGSEWAETSGLGPCIGVAIVFNARVSITHLPGAHANSEYDAFCNKSDELVPVVERASIRPIVARGNLAMMIPMR